MKTPLTAILMLTCLPMVAQARPTLDRTPDLPAGEVITVPGDDDYLAYEVTFGTDGKVELVDGITYWGDVVPVYDAAKVTHADMMCAVDIAVLTIEAIECALGNVIACGTGIVTAIHAYEDCTEAWSCEDEPEEEGCDDLPEVQTQNPSTTTTH